jgi:hypothetical protein
MRYLIIIFLFSIVGCGNQHKMGHDNVVSDSIIEIVNSDYLLENQYVDGSDSVVIYTYENDTLFQKVELKFISEKSISFVLTSKNKQRNKLSKIEGLAKSKVDLDPEIDEDEEGNAYPAEQYFFEKSCELLIRVDIEQKNKLRVIEANCENQHDSVCPFTSVGILRSMK